MCLQIYHFKLKANAFHLSTRTVTNVWVSLVKTFLLLLFDRQVYFDDSHYDLIPNEHLSKPC